MSVRKASRLSKPAKERCGEERCFRDSLRIIAFSDYASHDVATVIDFVRRSPHVPDLFLYAGEAVDCHNPISFQRLRELASLTKLKLGATLGNSERPASSKETRWAPASYNDGARTQPSTPSGEVRDISRTPIFLGKYALTGRASSNDSGWEKQTCSFSPGRKLVYPKANVLRGSYAILLSHASLHEMGDKSSPGHYGSRALRELVTRQRNIRLVVSGGDAFSGGKAKNFSKAVVVNVTSSADPGQPGRIALIELRQGKVARIKWVALWDLVCLPGMNPQRKTELQRAGVYSPCDLAEVSIENISRAIHAGLAEAARLRAQASAFCSQNIVLLRSFPLPADNRVYLTFENCAAGDDIRLVGFHMESRDRTRILFAETANDEKRLLVRMLRLLAPSSELNLICFSGGLWQQQLLSRRLACHGLPTRIAQSIRDIYFDIQNCLVFPTRRLGLRDVAESCGFRWRGFPAGQQADSEICSPSRKLTKTQKQKLLRRTQQDLLALRHVVLFLDKMMPPS